MSWLDELFSNSQGSGGGVGSLEPETYSSQVIKCDRPLLAVYTGPANVSLTADKAQAKDNMPWRLLFPAGSWTTMALSLDLDPTQTVAYEFVSTADDHEIEFTFSAAGGGYFTAKAQRVKLG